MTTIGWTHRPETRGESWNPITGCTRVSPGCEMCYAETLSHRLAAMGQPKYQGVTKPSGKWSGKVLLHEDRLEEPARWKKPRTIFVCSMSDLFHEEVPDEFIYSLLENTILRHTYIILTKRAERMAEIMTEWAIEGDGWCENVWLGVSVEDQQRADERTPHLLSVPAAVRFLSVEPLLAPVDISLFTNTQVETGAASSLGCRWVIAGGESGPGARPCHLDWLRSIRDQCAAAAVPFFLKQLGADPWDWTYHSELPTDEGSVSTNHLRPISDGHGRKKRSGTDALLDGELHHEWPLVTQEVG